MTDESLVRVEQRPDDIDITPVLRVPTDAEAMAKLERAREIARERGMFDLPMSHASEFAPRIPSLPTFEPPPQQSATWEPVCVTAGCGQPLGYRAKLDKYGAVVLCAACRAGSIEERLRLSGISYVEMEQPLSALLGSAPDFVRYMSFLKKFANLKPGERLKPPFAFVYGSRGVGKSAGAQRALRDAIKRGCQGRFVTLQGLLHQIYDTYGSEKSVDMLGFFSSVHLLVVDSVGHEHATEHSMANFFELVNDRWRNCLPTIFEANYAPTQASLGAVQGDNDARTMAILDRIRGGAGEQVFQIIGKSKRG